MDPDDCIHPGTPIDLGDGRHACQACGTVYEPPVRRTRKDTAKEGIERARAALRSTDTKAPTNRRNPR